MSWDVENTEEDLDPLRGARIISAKIQPPPFPGEGRILELKVRFREGLILTEGPDEPGYREGIYQVWCDAEGNGPGHIALVGFQRPVDKKAPAS